MNINSALYSITNYSFILLIAIIGIGLIILAFYVKIKDIQWKKKGIPLKFKVIKCEKKESINKEDNIAIYIAIYYETTFEFEYNKKTEVKSILTEKSFKVGSVHKGLLLRDKNNSTISVGGEGFFLAPGGEIVIFFFGIMFFLIPLGSILNFSFKLLFIIFLGFALIILGWIYFWPLLYSHKKKNKKPLKNYNMDYNSPTTIDSNLARYIPKYTPKENNKAYLFLALFLIIIGLITTYITGQDTIKCFKIKWTYPQITAMIKSTYIYNYIDPENNQETEEKLVGIIYQYEVDGKQYQFDYKSTMSPAQYSSKKKTTTNLYYDKNNPSDATTNSEINSSLAPPTIGVLFIMLGIIILIYEIKKNRSYNNYIIKEEMKS